MNERQDAYDLAPIFGDEIVRSQIENVAEDGSPAKTMKECAIGGLEHKCVPRGGIVVARITNHEGITHNRRPHREA